MDFLICGNFDLTKICRTCLGYFDKMKYIFDNQSSPTLYDMLMEVSPIQVDNKNELPTSMCEQCIIRLTDAYNFKQLTQKSEITLQDFLNQKIEYLDEDMLVDEDIKIKIELDSDDYEDGDAGAEMIIKNLNNAYEIIDDNQKQELQNNFESIKYNQSSYTKHEGNSRQKTNNKVFQCPECPRTFKRRSMLEVHAKEHSFSTLCTICGKKYGNHKALKSHMRLHSDERPHKCKVCPRAFRHTGSLKAHMRAHTGERPFLCSTCGKEFRQPSDLRYHMRSHTKERPYHCKLCPKTFQMSWHLAQHTKVHTGERPYPCNACGKSFYTKTLLTRHVVVHTGEKPYTCHICKKSFNRSSTLRVHVFTHTSKRPHMCNVCGKGFIQANCLRMHQKTHASTEIELKNDVTSTALT